jgi:UDP-GlcNAc:undecaprenyl-phosphate GlcNAc-1-phosphate transferase
MNLTMLSWASGKAFLVSLLLTPIVRDVFRAYNVVDRPGRRKVHSYPIPRVGGVSIMVAYAFALLSLRGHGSPFPAHWIQTVLSGALIIFFVGLLDDFVNLRPNVKLLGQIIAATTAFFNGIRIENLDGIVLPIWISLPVRVFWLLLTTNALNLIDGLDGLCAGIGLWATLALFAAALTDGNATLAYTILPLGGALLGFLFFNFNPATVFLGDSGALLTGFMLGCFGILLTGQHLTAGSAAFLALALCVPLMDLGLSIVRRLLRNRPIFSADRGHSHHRLLDRGLTVRRSAAALYGAEIAGAGFGLALYWLSLGYHGPAQAALTLIVISLALLAAVFGIRYLRYPEFEVVGHFLFAGGIRSAFAQKLRMRQLKQSLAVARTQDEWWRLVLDAAGEERWIRLSWMNSGQVVHDAVLNDRKACWSFTADLDGGASIRVDGDESTARGSSDLIAFLALLNGSRQENRSKWLS